MIFYIVLLLIILAIIIWGGVTRWRFIDKKKEDYEKNDSSDKIFKNNGKPFIFQIIIGGYKRIPDEIQNRWKKFSKFQYEIINNEKALEFLNLNFNKEIVDAFLPGNSKWKADLLRFCLMSKYSGIYCDVDILPTNNLLNIPDDIDTMSCIGCFTPTTGISPLPKGEIAIGFIKCNTPDPIFMEFISHMTPNVVASGKPYGINIQGLYKFLCKRLHITEILPFKKYIDPINNRSYYFLKEKRKYPKDNIYEIINKNNQIVLHSQHFKHEIFY